MNAHPEWLAAFLAQLKRLWPLSRQLNVIMADDEFWQHYGYPDSTDGLCQILPDIITIYIRDTAEDTNYWRGVVLHEYAHAILAPLVDAADQTPEYVAAVEEHVWRLGALIAITVPQPPREVGP